RPCWRWAIRSSCGGSRPIQIFALASVNRSLRTDRLLECAAMRQVRRHPDRNRWIRGRLRGKVACAALRSFQGRGGLFVDESGFPALPTSPPPAGRFTAGVTVTEIALEETASTNAHALELLKQGASAPHLTLIWARRQTKGRGRGGRPWQSPEGNVFFSMILRPQADWGDLNQLPLVTSVATRAAIRHHVPSSRAVTIKWPNDVLIDGAKVSGTLIESHRLIRSTDVDRWSAEAL